MSNAAPFKINGVYCRLIPLSRGQFTIVNADDYTWLVQWKWYAILSKTTNTWYAVRTITPSPGKRKTVYMHRQILDVKSELFCDHKEPKETLDNTRGNLREASRSQNSQNSTLRRGTKFSLKGVAKRGRRYSAVITVAGKAKRLGTFATPEAAHSAYCRGAESLFGEFARAR
jgi:hypothetical protein